MKKIIILHGWDASPHDAWFWRAKETFEDKGYKVDLPELPGHYFPDYDGWLKIIKDLDPDENTILIGHSLGAVAIMRYLEDSTKKVSQVILAAMPLEPMRFTPIAPFFHRDWQWANIKTKTEKINLIYEEGDQVVPLEQGKIAAEKLDADLMIVPGASHLLKLDVNLLTKIVEEGIDG